MRKTKIVCTIGPSSSDETSIKQLAQAGMDVARLNFSHGTQEEHGKVIDIIRKISAEIKKPIAILQDLCGPKIRLGNIKDGKQSIFRGNYFRLYAKERLGDESGASVTYPRLSDDVKPGDKILIDDGLIELQAEDIRQDEIKCRIVTGGEIKSHKGVNFPGIKLSIPSLTEKDLDDLKFGIEKQVDFAAVSFVRSAEDLIPAYDLMTKMSKVIPLISKIEKPEAVTDIERIIDRSYGIMVARGDLGVELPFENLPLIQKKIIYLCNKSRTPVITATQMLDSMIRNPSPTRAEVTDVANAVLDGSDAVMLSGETAAGAYPVKAVETMRKIVAKAEEGLNYENIMNAIPEANNAADILCLASCEMALKMSAKAIMAYTATGKTARYISRYRPNCPVIAVTDSQETYRLLALSWGVVPIYIKGKGLFQKTLPEAIASASAANLITQGDLIVITAGIPDGMRTSANMLMFQVVGASVLRGKGMGNLRVASGRAIFVPDTGIMPQDKRRGDIAIVKSFSCVKNPSEYYGIEGLITLEPPRCNDQDVNYLKIPIIAGVPSAKTDIKEGTLVTVDAKRGLAYFQ